MAYEEKPFTAAVWPNDRGGKSAFKGKMSLDDGREMWVDVYDNETKDGRKYYKIVLSPKVARASAPEPQPTQVNNVSDAINDEVPF